MKHVLKRRHPRVKHTVMRDAHAAHEIAIKTETNDVPVKRHNQKMRNEARVVEGQSTPMMDGALIECVFQFSSQADFQMARKKDPDLFQDVLHGNDYERSRATQRMKLLYPNEVLTAQRGDATRKVQ